MSDNSALSHTIKTFLKCRSPGCQGGLYTEPDTFHDAETHVKCFECGKINWNVQGQCCPLIYDDKHNILKPVSEALDLFLRTIQTIMEVAAEREGAYPDRGLINPKDPYLH